MSKIKICGLCTVEDIEAANRYQPDYVGFVFAPSKRRITPEIARKLRQRLDKGIQTVGVFVNEKPAFIARLVYDGIIGCIQLHGNEDNAYREGLLRHRIGCPVIQAVPIKNDLPACLPGFADFLLFDTASDVVRGGTGKTFDWSLLKEIRKPFFLAGGLREDNVAQAITSLSPYCVDTSSGVETDGQKDPEKIRRFIEIVRR